MLFFLHWSFIKLNALEHFKWESFHNKSPNKWQTSNTNADEVPFHIKGESLDSFSSVFNQNNLDYKCEDHDYKEERIVEEAREDIEFTRLDLSGIDEVEKLKENEDLEY